MLAMYFF
jgi:hypothetical protein